MNKDDVNMYVPSNKLPLKEMRRYGMSILLNGKIIGFIVDEKEHLCYIIGKKGMFSTEIDTMSNLVDYCPVSECCYRRK